MSEFKVGLRAVVTGENDYKRLVNEIKRLGIAFDETSDASEHFTTINGQRVKAYSVDINTLSKNKQNLIRTFMAGVKASSAFGAEIDDTRSSVEQITKKIDSEAAALRRANQAAARFTQTLSNLAAKQAVLSQAQQARLDQTTANRDLNRANNAAEFDRRRNQRLLDEQDRFERQQRMMNERHQLAMQRMSAFHGGAGPGAMINATLGQGAIMKVLAYDALRRTLTNIYQSIGKVADGIANWTVETLKFNDELNRSKTVFTTLAMIGMKNPDGTPMTMEQAAGSSDQTVKTKYSKAQKISDDMLDRATRIAIMTGQDMNEIIASMRQFLPDAMNKTFKKSGPNPLLTNPQGLGQTTEDFVNFAALFKMSDPAGRKLSWHMIALQELMSGTSGGKKDAGMEMVKSLRTREGVKISQDEALPIAKAVNSGDLRKATELVGAILERAGMSAATARNQLNNTIQANFDALETVSKRLSTIFFQPLYDNILKDSIAVRETALDILGNEKFKSVLKTAGKSLMKIYNPISQEIIKFVDWIAKSPDKLATYLTRFSDVISDFSLISMNSLMAVGNFIGGLMGISDGKKLDVSSIIEFTNQLRIMGNEAGIKFKYIMQQTLNGMTPLTNNTAPAMIAVLDTLSGTLDSIKAVVIGVDKVLKTFGVSVGKLSATITVLFASIGIGIRKALGMIPGVETAMPGFNQKVNDDYEVLKQYINDNFGGDKYNPAFMPNVNERQARVDEFYKNHPNEYKGLKVTEMNAILAEEARYKTGRIFGPNKEAFGPTQEQLGPKQPAMYHKIVASQPQGKTIDGMKVAPIAMEIKFQKNQIQELANNIKLDKKPIQLTSPMFKQEVRISLSGVTIQASDAQDFMNQLLKLNRGKVVTGRALPNGPLSPREFANRGITNY